jgi:hypothetical protein
MDSTAAGFAGMFIVDARSVRRRAALEERGG